MSENEPSDLPPGAPASLAEFGALQGKLAGSQQRSSVLHKAGLDELTWEAIERQWDETIATLIENAPPDVVPSELVSYHDAFVGALAGGGDVAPLSLKQFAKATAIIERGGDPTSHFAAMGISLTAYLQASEYWTKRLGNDTASAILFLKLRDAPGTQP